MSLDERKAITSKIFDMVNKKQEKANFSHASNHGIPNGMVKKGERGPRNKSQSMDKTDFVDNLPFTVPTLFLKTQVQLQLNQHQP